MAQAGTVFVDLKINTAQALAQVKAAGAEAGAAFNASTTVAEASKSQAALKGIGVAGLAAAVGVAKLGKDSVEAAENLEKAVARTSVVFGASRKSIEDWAKDSSTSMGKAKADALNVADAYGNVAKTAGLSGQQQAEFAKDLAQRTADIASAQGKDFDTVQAKILAGLNGRGKALKQYGIDINDASLKDEAMREGLIKTTDQALTPAQKTLASYGLVMRDTANQAGFFADHQDRLGESSAIAKAKIENAKAEIGESLLPVMAEGATVVGHLADAFSKLPAPVQTGLGAVAGVSGVLVAANSAMKLFGSRLTDLGPVLRTVTGEIKGFGVEGAVGVAALGAAIYELDQNAKKDNFARLFGDIDTSKPRAAIDALKASVQDLNGVGLASTTWSEKVSGRLADVLSGSGSLASQFLATKERADGLQQTIDGINDHLKGLSGKDKVAFLTQLQQDADAAGIHVDGLTQYLDKLKDAASGAGIAGSGLAGGTRLVAGGLTDVAKAAKDAADHLDATTKATQSLNDAVHAQIDPFFGVLDATRQLTAAQTEDAKTKTEQGQKAQDVAEASLALDDAQRNLVASIKDGKTSFDTAKAQLDGMKASGALTTDQYNFLLGALLRTTAGIQQYNQTPVDPKTASIDTAQAQAALDALAGKIGYVNGLKVYPRGFVGPLPPGSVRQQANGGVVQAFADGGFPSDPVIQPTRPGGLIKAFESEAGPWEGFVSGAPQKIARSRMVTKEIAKRLGGEASFADGGIAFAGGGVLDTGLQQYLGGPTKQDYANLAAAIKDNTVVAGHTVAEWRNLASAIAKPGGHTAQEWQNLERAQNGGHTIAEWQNLDRAEHGGHTTEEWNNLAKAIANDPATQAQQDAAKAAADLAVEQAKNQHDYRLQQLDDAKQFDAELAQLRQDQVGQVQWSDPWTATQRQIDQVVKAQQDFLTQLAADRAKATQDQVDAINGKTAGSTTAPVVIQKVEVHSNQEPKAWLDELPWRFASVGVG